MPIKLVRIVRKKRNKTLTLTAGQYTQDETIADELRTMRAADFEQKVDVVWSLILGHYLSKGKGYVHARENRVRKGYVDIYTKQWVRRPGHQDRVQCPFLITQCKRQKRQWRDEAWDEGRHQIDKYLKGLKRKKSWKHPSYGIVAAGKYVASGTRKKKGCYFIMTNESITSSMILRRLKIFCFTSRPPREVEEVVLYVFIVADKR